MQKKFSYIKERIKTIAENKGIPLGKFFKELGVSPTGFTGEKIKKGVNSETIEKIISIHSDVDLHWLVTGEKKYVDVNTRDNLVSEPEEENGYKAKYYDCLEKYMRLNEEMNAYKKSNSNLKKPDSKVLDKP